MNIYSDYASHARLPDQLKTAGAAGVLVGLYIGLNVLWRYQADRLACSSKQAAKKMMCPAACFHRDNARGQSADKICNSITTKPSAQNDRAGLFELNEAAHILAKINSKHK